MKASGFVVASFVASLVAAVGCSGGSSNGNNNPSMATLSCTDSGNASANVVTIRCDLTASTSERVDVTMGGPASGATTLRGLNFDITYDGLKLQFIPSASYTSPLFPGALIGVALDNGLDGRLVVSIQEPGGSAPVAVGPGQPTVLSLTFQRVAGTTFTPTPLAFDNAEATSASAPITFHSGLTLAYQ